jgi:hypothetical protein
MGSCQFTYIMVCPNTCQHFVRCCMIEISLCYVSCSYFTATCNLLAVQLQGLKYRKRYFRSERINWVQCKCALRFALKCALVYYNSRVVNIESTISSFSYVKLVSYLNFTKRRCIWMYSVHCFLLFVHPPRVLTASSLLVLEVITQEADCFGHSCLVSSDWLGRWRK